MKFRLLQARNPGDPVREEERAAFAARLGVPVDDVIPFDLLGRTPSAARVTDGVDAVLVGGSGAFSIFDDAPWIPAFVDTIGELAHGDVPVFASCFGFQALVVALGGTVRTDPENPEVGSFDLTLTPEASSDPLFAGLPERFVAQEGHKDRAYDFPASLVHLASSPRCRYQAARVADRPVWATQFHPELTAADNKQRFMRYFDLYKKAFGAEEADRVANAFRESPEASGLLGRFRAWVEAR